MYIGIAYDHNPRLFTNYHRLLNPKLAFWTLFIVGSCGKLNKFLIFFTKWIADLEFLARHISMPSYSAAKTVLFETLCALESDWIFWRVKEYIFATCSWTPTHSITIHVEVVLQGELLIFLQILYWQNLSNVSFCYLLIARVVGTFQRKLSLCYWGI